MKKITSNYLRTNGVLLLFAVLLLPATNFIMAHGTVTSPASRIWNCKAEGERPTSEGCQAAGRISVSYIYDWNGVRQGNADGNHRGVLPDGRLASGGDQYFRGLDLTGVAWKTTSVTPGPFTVTWTNSAPHLTAYYRVYVTKQGWDPNGPIGWDDLELITDTGPRGQESTANIPVVLPNRSGKHVLFSVWQRSDSPEAFYSVSDIDYGGGGGGGNVGPSVSVSSPSNGATFTTGDQVRLTANASDSDGSVSRVVFFVNGNEVNTDNSAPYEYTWTATEGDITISADAVDNDDALVTSSSVSITVTGSDGETNRPPDVAVTSPSNNDAFQVSDQVRIVADVFDPDGSIASVTFFAGGDELETITSPPYEIDWVATEGDITLAASATDNEGATTRSSSVAVSVTVDGGGNDACDDIATYAENEVYLNGAQVSFNNIIYEAKWWTRGQNPESNSTIWAVWKVVGACGEANANQNASSEENFSVLYPNPSSDAVTIQTEGNDSDVRIIDATGREMMASDAVKSGETLDISNLRNGIYFVEIYKNGVKEKSSRIIKE